MLTFYAIWTSIIWVKTIFFTPYHEVKPELSAFDSSALRKVLTYRTKSRVRLQTPCEEEATQPSKPVWSSVLTVNFALLTLFFLIINVRINAFAAWFLPWLQWKFSGREDKENYISLCLDVFGYSYYVSLLIAPLPGLLVAAIKRYAQSAESNKHAVNCLLSLVVILSGIISIQTAKKNTSIPNAVLLTIEYSLLRTIFFIARSMVCP